MHNKKQLGILLVITTLVLGLWPISAAWTQGQAQVTLGEADLSRFSRGFSDIGLPVTVLNANGVPILGLQADSFEALEDDSPVTVQKVVTQSNPELSIAVALVLDLSGSAPIEDVREAAHQLLNCLGPNDRVALIGFNTPLEIGAFDLDKEHDFTSNPDAVRSVVDRLVSVGESAVYEAIYKGVLITSEEIADRRAVIVMTDGYDTASRPQIATAGIPKTAAKERGVPIFTVGVYDPDFASDPDYLKVLAQETGGRYQDQEAGDLGTLFQNVVEQLRTEYRLTLHTDLEPDGKDHVLKIRVTTQQGVGEAERTVSYPDPPPIPRILKLQRDVNGELEDVETGAEVTRRVLLVPQISAKNPLARVEYYVGGMLDHTADVETMRGQERHETWEWEWDTCTVVEGDHTLEIIAYDDAGNASEPFSLELRVVRSPWCVITENVWLVFAIVAGVILIVLVLFLVLRHREERCPVCGNVMDPNWGGVCQFCEAEAASTGPSTITTPSNEPPTAPQVPRVPPEGRYKSTAAIGAMGTPQPPGIASAEPPPPAKTERLRREPQVMGWLVVEKGPRAGQEFRLQEITAIGRSGNNDVIIDDPSVSRQHAKVRLEGKVFTIFDLGATNPTKVNGLEIGKHQLIDGDRVEIGNALFVFKQVKTPQT